MSFSNTSSAHLLIVSTCTTTLCLKKVSTFELAVSLSNRSLTDFQNFCTAGERIKFAVRNLYITHLTLGRLLHYLGKLKSLFVDIQQTSKKMQTKCILSAPILIPLCV